MNWRRARHIVILAVTVAACGSDEPGSLDPTATYEVYGDPFEPGVAVPAHAVMAEPEAFVGRNVIVEGTAGRACPEPACLTTLTPGPDGEIRIFMVPNDGDTLDVPRDVAGRRIVVSGRLEVTADSAYRLYATGIMTEKVRR